MKATIRGIILLAIVTTIHAASFRSRPPTPPIPERAVRSVRVPTSNEVAAARAARQAAETAVQTKFAPYLTRPKKITRRQGAAVRPPLSFPLLLATSVLAATNSPPTPGPGPTNVVALPPQTNTTLFNLMMTSAGYYGSQTFRTVTGKDPAEPNHCGTVGGASFWFSYVPATNLTLNLSTAGTTYENILAVYHDDGRNLGYASLVLDGCDRSYLSTGKVAAVSVALPAGRTNYIVMDGVNGAFGLAYLRYSTHALTIVNVARWDADSLLLWWNAQPGALYNLEEYSAIPPNAGNWRATYEGFSSTNSTLAWIHDPLMAPAYWRAVKIP